MLACCIAVSRSSALLKHSALTNTVKLASKDLKHNQREAELAQRGADVGAFEGALGGADLDELFVGEDDGAGAVEA